MALFSIDGIGVIDIQSNYILIKSFNVFIFHFSSDPRLQESIFILFFFLEESAGCIFLSVSPAIPVHLSSGLSARP